MRKLFISADLEGCCNVTAWEETLPGGMGYERACQQLTREVAAACKAGIEAGYEVWVKDGHEMARNIDPLGLPEEVHLIQGWLGTPLSMLAGLDETFDGVIYIGYHSPSYSAGSPLAHTVNHEKYQWMKLNGEMASEFHLNSILADEMGVPSIFLSGDLEMCRLAKDAYPSIGVYAVKEGIGGGTCNVHPNKATAEIERGVRTALEGLAQKKCVRPMECSYTLEINFKDHRNAKNGAWYPGAELKDSFTVSVSAASPFELARARMFIG